MFYHFLVLVNSNFLFRRSFLPGAAANTPDPGNPSERAEHCAGFDFGIVHFSDFFSSTTKV